MFRRSSIALRSRFSEFIVSFHKTQTIVQALYTVTFINKSPQKTLPPSQRSPFSLSRFLPQNRNSASLCGSRASFPRTTSESPSIPRLRSVYPKIHTYLRIDCIFSQHDFNAPRIAATISGDTFADTVIHSSPLSIRIPSLTVVRGFFSGTISFSVSILSRIFRR